MSFTVTVVVQVDWFPLLSITVRVAMLAPICVQLYVKFGCPFISNDCMVQLSELRLLIDAAVTVTSPVVALRFTDKGVGRQLAVGRMVSRTVIVLAQVAVFPLPSATISVTECGLAVMLEQVNVRVVVLGLPAKR